VNTDVNTEAGFSGSMFIAVDRTDTRKPLATAEGDEPLPAR
jgi:hypothetical protein